MFSDTSDIVCMKGLERVRLVSVNLFKDIRSTTTRCLTWESTTSGPTSGQARIRFQNTAMDNVWECIQAQRGRFIMLQAEVDFHGFSGRP